MSREHIRFLLGEMHLGPADLDVLATQLTAALDGPLLLYLSSAILTQTRPQVSERLGRGWKTWSSASRENGDRFAEQMDPRRRPSRGPRS